MDNIDFSVTSDLEKLISQTKFERIFFLCGKKSYYLSGAYRAFKKTVVTEDQEPFRDWNFFCRI